MVIEFYAAALQVFEVPDISITLAGLFHQPGLRPKPSVRFYLNFLTGKLLENDLSNKKISGRGHTGLTLQPKEIISELNGSKIIWFDVQNHQGQS